MTRQAERARACVLYGTHHHQTTGQQDTRTPACCFSAIMPLATDTYLAHGTQGTYAYICMYIYCTWGVWVFGLICMHDAVSDTEIGINVYKPARMLLWHIRDKRRACSNMYFIL